MGLRAGLCRCTTRPYRSALVSPNGWGVLTADNAAMIAWTAILRLQAGLEGEPFDLPIRKKWSLEDLYDDVPDTCYRS